MKVFAVLLACLGLPANAADTAIWGQSTATITPTDNGQHVATVRATNRLAGGSEYVEVVLSCATITVRLNIAKRAGECARRNHRQSARGLCGCARKHRGRGKRDGRIPDLFNRGDAQFMMRKPTHIIAASWGTALALNARVGCCDPRDVQRLATFVTEVLAPDHPVRVAVGRFTGRYAPVRHQRGALADLGGELQADLLRAIRPVPPGSDRADLNG